MSAAPGIHRAYWYPLSQEEWADYYGIGQTGHGMTYFHGSPHQRGSGLGSLFGGLIRAIMPAAKSALKAVGREAIRTGIGVASDALAGQNVAQSFETRGRQAASTLLNKAGHKVNQMTEEQQTGGGVGTLINTKPAHIAKPINRTRNVQKKPARKRKKANDNLSY